METIYVFGAGASHQCGLPLLNELLPTALRHPGLSAMIKEGLDKFLRDIYDLPQRECVDVPNIEEVISIIELAMDEDYNESKQLGGFKLDDLKKIELDVYKIIFNLLCSDNFIGRGIQYSYYSAFLEEIFSIDPTPENKAFISFNYDVLFDKALHYVRSRNQNFAKGNLINYGYPFNILNGDNLKEDQPLLIKLHGSLKWGWCTPCKKYYVDRSDTFERSLTDINNIPKCQNCQAPLEPVIIPPVPYKMLRSKKYELYNVLRNLAIEKIKTAAKIVFIGYSLPSIDIDMLYVFKKAISENKGGIIIEIVNPEQEVEKRFRTEFGGIHNTFRNFRQYIYSLLKECSRDAQYNIQTLINFYENQIITEK